MLEAVIFALITVALAGGGLALWRLVRGPARRPLALVLRVALAALAAALLIAFSAWKLSNATTVQLFGGIVPRVETSGRLVAVTFDDGPTARFTGEVLDILREEDVRATFFVTGKGLARNPEAGRLIVEAGHELGNHSFTHSRMILKPYAAIRGEIEETDRLIRAAGYEGDIHFRAPFGKKLVMLPYYLWRTGRRNIAWDVAPEGYAGTAAGAGGLVEVALREARPGSIILLHVMAASRETSREALPEIIRGLREQGYRFVTVSELLAASPD